MIESNYQLCPQKTVLCGRHFTTQCEINDTVLVWQAAYFAIINKLNSLWYGLSQDSLLSINKRNSNINYRAQNSLWIYRNLGRIIEETVWWQYCISLFDALISYVKAMSETDLPAIGCKPCTAIASGPNKHIVKIDPVFQDGGRQPNCIFSFLHVWTNFKC